MEQPPNMTLTPDILYPKCPSCEEQPARVISAPFIAGTLTMLSIFCGNPLCCKIFSVIPIGPARQEEPLIATTGVMPSRRTH